MIKLNVNVHPFPCILYAIGLRAEGGGGVALVMKWWASDRFLLIWRYWPSCPHTLTCRPTQHSDSLPGSLNNELVFPSSGSHSELHS